VQSLRSNVGPLSRRVWPRGFTLMELMVTVVIMGVLVAISAPHFGRSLEQARADFAVANLRAIWAAQRIYWLEHHTYADKLKRTSPTDPEEMYELGLLDPSIVAAGDYSYTITSSGPNTFTAQAARAPIVGWTGVFTINQDGTTGGVISAGGTMITPGFQ
jgi:prepilin-type N-terminal cleavage/methylation domain-containing protein